MRDTASPDPLPDAPKPELRRVSAPIPISQLSESFSNKSIVFLVNFSQTKLPAEVFLTYITNLTVPTEVVFDHPQLSDAEYNAIMGAYLHQTTVCNSKHLAMLAAQLMLWAKGVAWDAQPYRLGTTLEQVRSFGIANSKFIQQWLQFIDSATVYAQYAIPKLREQSDPELTLPHITDRNCVGHNVVNLFTVPRFTELYFSLPETIYLSAFYTHQFKDYMFNSKRLEHWFSSPNNFIGLITTGIAAGVINPQRPGDFLLPQRLQHAAPKPPTFSADPVLDEPGASNSVPPVAQP